jgi:hypothetical protein
MGREKEGWLGKDLEASGDLLFQSSVLELDCRDRKTAKKLL